jgi:hypothetical protein
MNNEKLTKGFVIIYASLGIVFITYVIVSMFNGFKHFDNVIFPIYFVTLVSSSYLYKNILKHKFILYSFIIMAILFLIFLVKTYLI